MTQEVSLSEDVSAMGDVLAVFNTSTVSGDRYFSLLDKNLLLFVAPSPNNGKHSGRNERVGVTRASFSPVRGVWLRT